MAAQHDIKNGTLKYKVYGELHPHEETIVSDVENTYGIELVRVASDVIEDDDEKDEWDSYNETISEYAFRMWTITNVLDAVIADKMKNANGSESGLEQTTQRSP